MNPNQSNPSFDFEAFEKSRLFLHELHCIGSLPSVLKKFSNVTGWMLTYHCVDSLPNFLKTDSPSITLGQPKNEGALSGPLSPETVRELAEEEEDLWLPVEIRSGCQKLWRHLFTEGISESISENISENVPKESTLNESVPETAWKHEAETSGEGTERFSSDPCAFSSAQPLQRSETASIESHADRTQSHADNAGDSAQKKTQEGPKSENGFSHEAEFLEKILGGSNCGMLDFLNHPIGFLHLSRNAPSEKKRKSDVKDFLGTSGLVSLHDTGMTLRIPFQEARQLAVSLCDLIAEMQLMRFNLWLSEMELTVHSSMPDHVRNRQNRLFAARYRELLDYMRSVLGMDAIGIYFFNAQNQTFKLRACAGLSIDTLLHSVRTLEEAQADWRAFQDNQLIIQDETTYCDGYLIPEMFPSGLCMPLKAPGGAMGSIWFFSNGNYFSEQTIQLAQLMAVHLGMVLEHEAVLRRYDGFMKYCAEVETASNVQEVQKPVRIPGKGKLDVAGWAKTGKIPTLLRSPSIAYERGRHPQKNTVSGDFYDWFSLPEGKTMLALGSVGVSGMSGAILAASVRSALRSHAHYGHSTSDLLRNVYRTLWHQMASDAQISLFCGIAQQEANFLAIHFAQVGMLRGLIVRKDRSFELVSMSHKSNLFYQNGNSEFHYFADSIYLKPDELLLVFNDGLGEPSSAFGKKPFRQMSSEQLTEIVLGMDDFQEKKKRTSATLEETTRHSIIHALGGILSQNQNASAQLVVSQVRNYFGKHVHCTSKDQSALAIHFRSFSK